MTDPAPRPLHALEVHNARAFLRFEVFLVSAVATVLLVRSALAATGYPRVGGGGLHVAHVLYGGLLMAVAIAVLEIVPGSRGHTRAALFGGAGFGLFLDEVGKFLTKDVNYFFKPAVAIMYVVFVGFYLAVREAALRRPLTDQRRLALAAVAVADKALGQLDVAGRRAALDLLEGLPPSPLHLTLLQALEGPAVAAGRVEQWVTRLRDRLHRHALHALGTVAFARLVLALLVAQVFGLAAQVVLLVAVPLLGRGGGSHISDGIAGLASLVSAGYALTGVARCRSGDLPGALRVLYRSALVTLLVTQVLVFARYQWSGLAGLAWEGLLFMALRVVVHAVPAGPPPRA